MVGSRSPGRTGRRGVAASADGMSSVRWDDRLSQAGGLVVGMSWPRGKVMLLVRVKSGGNSEDLETMASAPAAKRASEQSIVRPSASRVVTGPQFRDPKRYHVLGEHGRGGLGRVSRAHDRELGRDVAIKELISRNDV